MSKPSKLDCGCREVMEMIAGQLDEVRKFIEHCNENPGEIPNRSAIFDAKDDINFVIRAIDRYYAKP